jgi:hypothetical protein
MDLKKRWKEVNQSFSLTTQDISSVELIINSAMSRNQTSIELFDPKKIDGYKEWAEKEDLKFAVQTKPAQYERNHDPRESPTEISKAGTYVTLSWAHWPRK